MNKQKSKKQLTITFEFTSNSELDITKDEITDNLESILWAIKSDRIKIKDDSNLSGAFKMSNCLDETFFNLSLKNLFGKKYRLKQPLASDIPIGSLAIEAVDSLEAKELEKQRKMKIEKESKFVGMPIDPNNKFISVYIILNQETKLMLVNKFILQPVK